MSRPDGLPLLSATEVPDALMQSAELTPPTRLLAYAILYHCGGGRVTKATNKALLSTAGIGITSLTRGLRDLIESGWVQVETVTDADGRRCRAIRFLDGNINDPYLAPGRATANGKGGPAS